MGVEKAAAVGGGGGGRGEEEEEEEEDRLFFFANGNARAQAHRLYRMEGEEGGRISSGMPTT